MNFNKRNLYSQTLLFNPLDMAVENGGLEIVPLDKTFYSKYEKVFCNQELRVLVISVIATRI